MTIWHMAVCAACTWIEKYQPLTVGIIGFAGVIATLLINARQARIQRRKERFHERQALRVALEEELRSNRESLVTSLESLNTNTALDKERRIAEYWVPTDEIEDVYRSFIDRIGLLSQIEVRKVMNAYLTLRSYTAALLLHSRLPKTDVRHVPISVKLAPKLIQKSLLDPLDEAIEVLERAREADTPHAKRQPL